MISKAIFVLLVIGTLQAYADQEKFLRWVDYNGEAPENAVPLGGNANGKKEYVGRAFFATGQDDTHFAYNESEGWIPTAVTAGETIVNITLIEKAYSSDKIQILTTEGNPRLEWKDVTSQSFPKLFDTEEYHPVRGGWECYGQICFNATLYIGRVHFSGGDQIGKIMLYSDNLQYINHAYLVRDGKAIPYESFASLIYYY